MAGERVLEGKRAEREEEECVEYNVWRDVEDQEKHGGVLDRKPVWENENYFMFEHKSLSLSELWGGDVQLWLQMSSWSFGEGQPQKWYCLEQRHFQDHLGGGMSRAFWYQAFALTPVKIQLRLCSKNILRDRNGWKNRVGFTEKMKTKEVVLIQQWTIPGLRFHTLNKKKRLKKKHIPACG